MKYNLNKLLIANENLFIGENEDGYFTTEKLHEAKDFKWCWLFAPRKYFLEGIRKRFGDKFRFERMVSIKGK